MTLEENIDKQFKVLVGIQLQLNGINGLKQKGEHLEGSCIKKFT